MAPQLTESVRSAAGSMVALLKASEAGRVNRHALAGDASFAETPIGDATKAVELLLSLGVLEAVAGYMVQFNHELADRLIAEHHLQVNEM